MKKKPNFADKAYYFKNFFFWLLKTDSKVHPKLQKLNAFFFPSLTSSRRLFWRSERRPGAFRPSRFWCRRCRTTWLSCPSHAKPGKRHAGIKNKYFNNKVIEGYLRIQKILRCNACRPGEHKDRVNQTYAQKQINTNKLSNYRNFQVNNN